MLNLKHLVGNVCYENTHYTVDERSHLSDGVCHPGATAARTRHVMKRPAVSLTLFRENELAIIVHGYAAIISPDHADFEALENLLYASTYTKAGEWGEGVYLHIQAEAIYKIG